MSIHEATPMFEINNPTINPVALELDHGLILKEWDEFDARKENTKSTPYIPLTVAHYISPSLNGVAFSNQAVSDHMKQYGMDVIPILGESFGYDLGLILEHQADPETVEFDVLVERMKICLQQLGWKYDGSVIEKHIEAELAADEQLFFDQANDDGSSILH